MEKELSIKLYQNNNIKLIGRIVLNKKSKFYEGYIKLPEEKFNYNGNLIFGNITKTQISLVQINPQEPNKATVLIGKRTHLNKEYTCTKYTLNNLSQEIEITNNDLKLKLNTTKEKITSRLCTEGIVIFMEKMLKDKTSHVIGYNKKGIKALINHRNLIENFSHSKKPEETTKVLIKTLQENNIPPAIDFR
jgi:hypothetical protein